MLSALCIDDQIEILSKLKPNPKRASELVALRHQFGENLRPKHYWPNLKCANTWKQGNCAQVLPRLDGYYPEGASIREFGYQASEARAGMVLGNDWDSSVLAIHIYHFEFVEESRRNDENPITLLAHQLKKGNGILFIFQTCLDCIAMILTM